MQNLGLFLATATLAAATIPSALALTGDDETSSWNYSVSSTTGKHITLKGLHVDGMTGSFDVALKDETGRHLKVQRPDTAAPTFGDETPFPTDSQGNQIRTKPPTVTPMVTVTPTMPPVVATPEPTSVPTISSIETTVAPTPVVVTPAPTSAPTIPPVAATAEPSVEASPVPTTTDTVPPPLECSTPCTQASECADTANLQGLNPDCGSLDCIAGTCRYEAWSDFGSCVDSNFVQCNGDDTMCTKGPGELPFVGTCTGYQNVVCFYYFCPVLPEDTTLPITIAPTVVEPTSVPSPTIEVVPTISPVTPEVTVEPTSPPTPVPTIEVVPTTPPVTPEVTLEPTSPPTPVPTIEVVPTTPPVTPEVTLEPTSLPTPVPTIEVVPTAPPVTPEVTMEPTSPPTPVPAPTVEVVPTSPPVTPEVTMEPTSQEVDCSSICAPGEEITLPNSAIEIPGDIAFTTCALLEIALRETPDAVKDVCPLLDSVYSEQCGCAPIGGDPTSAPAVPTEGPDLGDCPICSEGQLMSLPGAVIRIPPNILSASEIYTTCALLESAILNSRPLIEDLCPVMSELYAEPCGCVSPPTSVPTLPTEEEEEDDDCPICPDGQVVTNEDAVIRIETDIVYFATCGLLEIAIKEARELIDPLCPRLPELYAEICECKDPLQPPPTVAPTVLTEPECTICPAGESITLPNTVIEIPAGYVSDSSRFVTCQLLENALNETPETLESLCPRLEELYAAPCGCEAVRRRGVEIPGEDKMSAAALPRQVSALRTVAIMLLFVFLHEA